MRDYNGHVYTWSAPYGLDDWIQHRWELRSAGGGVHFHISRNTKHPNDNAGLEFHSVHGLGAPDHVNCPVTGGRCWHDGTSLYATETLWPMIKLYLEAGNHAAIFKLLERELDRRERSLTEED